MAALGHHGIVNQAPKFSQIYLKFNSEVVPSSIGQNICLYVPSVRTESVKKLFYYDGSFHFNNFLE